MITLRPVRFCIGLILLIICAILTTEAAINQIPKGGTVFIGEEDLDISATGVQSGGEIAWWAPGTMVRDSVPSYSLIIANNTSFYTDPNIFSKRTGPWYTMPDRELAFYIQQPLLQIRIFDVATGRDRTSGKVVRGDELMFRIDSNLYTMKEREIAGAPVTIRVRNPNGVEYDSLINASGQRTSLIEIPVDSQSYYTVPIWDTGYRDYPFGVYEIWAECNANRMMDNYFVEGGTISTKERQGIEEIGIGITATTTIPGTPVTTTTSAENITQPTTITAVTASTPETTIVPATTNETAVLTTIATPATPGLLASSAIAALVFLLFGRRL